MAEVEAGIDPFFRKMGACHMIWRETKQILKQRYNLDWRTPAEMNLDIIFD